MRVDRYLQLVVAEGLRGLWGHRRTAAPAIAIIAVSLVVLGGFMMVSENLSGLLGRWRERGHLQVFMELDATGPEVRTVSERLEQSEAVESFRFIDAEEAAERFRRDFAELGDLLSFLEQNPLPPSFVVTVHPEWRGEVELGELMVEWSPLPGVDAVQYDLQIIRRLEWGVNGLRFGGGLLGGAVLLAAIITTANVIRVLVMERRREIVVLRLVGATEAVVRGRFLAEGAIQGLLGSALALLALYGAYKIGIAYVDAGVGPLGMLLPLRFLPVWLFAALIGGGMTAGLVGAWLAFGSAGELER